mmetsp:Transcript_30463/g.76276  ORF Transcript_30463/g.76276 Transcript_30463/m.76276 type:complete len:316 (+) Transcript_30463:599-1546(+)
MAWKSVGCHTYVLGADVVSSSSTAARSNPFALACAIAAPWVSVAFSQCDRSCSCKHWSISYPFTINTLPSSSGGMGISQRSVHSTYVLSAYASTPISVAENCSLGPNSLGSWIPCSQTFPSSLPNSCPNAAAEGTFGGCDVDVALMPRNAATFLLSSALSLDLGASCACMRNLPPIIGARPSAVAGALTGARVAALPPERRPVTRREAVTDPAAAPNPAPALPPSPADPATHAAASASVSAAAHSTNGPRRTRSLSPSAPAPAPAPVVVQSASSPFDVTPCDAEDAAGATLGLACPGRRGARSAATAMRCDRSLG